MEKLEIAKCDIKLGGRRINPYAFTEQGVASLSGILKSKVATKVNIAVMRTFVQMRKTIGNHQQLLQLSADFTKHKLETNEKFEHVFKALEGPETEQKQGSELSTVNSHLKKGRCPGSAEMTGTNRPGISIRKSVTEKITAQAVTWLPHRLSPENKQKFLRKKDGV